MSIAVLVFVGGVAMGVEKNVQHPFKMFDVSSEGVLAAKKCKGGKVWDTSKGKCTYPPSDNSRSGGGGY